MILPVDPTAELGAPREFIKLRDGTIIPLTGAFGEDIIKAGLQLGESPMPPIYKRPPFASSLDSRQPVRDSAAAVAPLNSQAAAYGQPQVLPGASVTSLPPPQADALSAEPRRQFQPGWGNDPVIQWLKRRGQDIGTFANWMTTPDPNTKRAYLRPNGTHGYGPGQPVPDTPLTYVGRADEGFGMDVAPISGGALTPEQGFGMDGQPAGILGEDPAATAAAVAAGKGVPYDPNAEEPPSALGGAKPKKKRSNGHDDGGTASAAGVPEAIMPAAGGSAGPAYAGGGPAPAGAFAGDAQSAGAGGATDYNALFEKLYGQIKTDPAELTDEDRKDLLTELGLRMAVASSRPGASLFGAAGEAGIGALGSRRQLKDSRRKEAADTAKLKMDLAKNVTDLAMEAEKIEIDRRKATSEYDLGLRRVAIDEQQLIAQQQHWRALEANAAQANAISLARLNRQTTEDRTKYNSEWRQTLNMLYDRAALATASGLPLMTEDEIQRQAAYSNPNAEGATKWAMDEYSGLLMAQDALARDLEMDPATKKAQMAEIQRRLAEIQEIWMIAPAEEADSEDDEE